MRFFTKPELYCATYLMSQFSIQAYQIGPNVKIICTRNEYQSAFSIPETLMLNKMAQDIREALEDRHGTCPAEHMGTVGTCSNQYLAAEKYPTSGSLLQCQKWIIIYYVKKNLSNENKHCFCCLQDKM